jgi:hypothetical protein
MHHPVERAGVPAARSDQLSRIRGAQARFILQLLSS